MSLTHPLIFPPNSLVSASGFVYHLFSWQVDGLPEKDEKCIYILSECSYRSGEVQVKLKSDISG